MSAPRRGEIVTVRGVVESIADGSALVKIMRPDTDGVMAETLVLVPLHLLGKP